MFVYVATNISATHYFHSFAARHQGHTPNTGGVHSSRESEHKKQRPHTLTSSVVFCGADVTLHSNTTTMWPSVTIHSHLLYLSVQGLFPCQPSVVSHPETLRGRRNIWKWHNGTLGRACAWW